MSPAYRARMLTAAITLLTAVVSASLGARFLHRRWLQETRLQHYAAFLTAVHDSMDEYVVHVGHSDIPVAKLQAANRQLQLARLVATPVVDRNALRLYAVRERMHTKGMSGPAAYEQHLRAVVDFMSAAREDLLWHRREPVWLGRLHNWAGRRRS